VLGTRARCPGRGFRCGHGRGPRPHTAFSRSAGIAGEHPDRLAEPEPEDFRHWRKAGKRATITCGVLRGSDATAQRIDAGFGHDEAPS
jgi:hypothetical protein